MSSSISTHKNRDNQILGGAYRQVRDTNQGGQVHHIPANSISSLDKDDGPAILMTTPDHQRTGSWGRGVQQRAYRNQQKYLIDTQGWNGFKEAMQMDVADLHRNFGDKYDPGINQALAYVQDNEVNLKQKFKDAIFPKEMSP